MVKSEHFLNMWKASSMGYCTFVFTLLSIANLHGITQARIYQTADAIITEGMWFLWNVYILTAHPSSMCWKRSLLVVILLSTSRKFELQVFSEFHIRYPCPSYNTNERRPRMQFHAQFNDLHYRWTFKLYSLFSMKTLYIKKANNSLLDGNGELWKASYKQNAVTNACFRLWQKISKLASLFVRWWTLIEKMLETSF